MSDGPILPTCSTLRYVLPVAEQLLQPVDRSGKLDCSRRSRCTGRGRGSPGPSMKGVSKMGESVPSGTSAVSAVSSATFDATPGSAATSSMSWMSVEVSICSGADTSSGRSPHASWRSAAGLPGISDSRRALPRRKQWSRFSGPRTQQFHGIPSRLRVSYGGMWGRAFRRSSKTCCGTGSSGFSSVYFA